MTTPAAFTLDDGITLEINLQDPAPLVLSTPTAPAIEVRVPGPQGPGNLSVGPVNTLSAGPGLWIQTGLGATGEDFTFWIEDGTIN